MIFLCDIIYFLLFDGVSVWHYVLKSFRFDENFHKSRKTMMTMAWYMIN